MNRFGLKSIGAAFLWLAMAGALSAQSNTGSISGSVLDPGGAAIPGAAVTATDTASGREYEAASSEAGLYVFPSLPTGIYEVSAEADGFKRLTRSNIEVRIAQRLAMDLTLEIGAVTETVEVTSVAPLLEANTSERGQSFSTKFMTSLPLFTGGIRNAEAFVTYMPGVNSGGGNQSIGGSGGRAKEVLIDGASLTIPESGGVVFNFPAAEMFGEFKLVTSTYSAEYGRFGGGVEIFTMKSGTNQLHATGFWNFRRDALNAAGWNNNTVGRHKPKERFNELGVGVGGPIYIPKVYDGRNKTFWFFTYSRDERPATATPTTSSVATALMRQGDFSEIGRAIYDPLTTAGQSRDLFANAIIPRSRFNTVAANILPYIPDANLNKVGDNYNFLNVSNLTDYHWSLKFDHAFNEQHRVSYSQTMQNQDTRAVTALPGPLGQGLGSSFQRPQNFRANHDWTPTPSLLIHTTWGLSKTRQGWDNPAQAGFASLVGLPADTDATPRILFDSNDNLTAFGVQDGKVANGFQNNITWHWNQAITWIKGKHEFKFGWDIRHLSTVAMDAAGTNGLYRFARAQTALPSNTGGTGNSFASFLLGAPTSAETAALPVPDVQIRYEYYSGFFQDNWKLTNRLTLNLGMRYEVPVGFHFANYQFSSVNLTIPNAAAGGLPGAMQFAGPGAGRTGTSKFYPTDYTAIGPRAGFAYRLTDKTVLRGGYGMFYQTLGNGGCGCTLGFAGAPTQVVSDGINGAFNFAGGIPVPANTARPPFIDPTFGNGRDVDYLGANFGAPPRNQNWSINVQHTVKNFLIDVAYVANRGTGLNSTIPLNQVDPKYLSLGPLLRQNINSPEVQAAGFTEPFAGFSALYGAGATLAQALRPYPQFRNVSSRNSGDGAVWYDAFQAKLERRFGSWQMMTSYTFSKSLVKLHQRQIFSQPGPQNAYDLSGERTIAQTDQPHVLNILNSFDLPVGKGRRFLNKGGVVNTIVGGWTVSAAQRYFSGNVAPATVSNTLANTLFNSQRYANPTGQSILTGVAHHDLDPANDNRYFNATAFALPSEFSFGTGSFYYRAFRQPFNFQENMSLSKKITLVPNGDQPVQLQLRADFFNLFNRNQFNVNTTLFNANFGRATSPNQGARVITMGLRIDF
ncbi:MAG: TonB-dependent receptor plug domain-containing protein [Acidobacteria bacterium]|nr:TonB-dependent receptor plug domain-containing protein [Acidobacteriota bacterium]